MTSPIKVLFDENFGEPVVKALAGVLAWCEDPIEVSHLFQFAKSGEKDDSWIPRIAPGGWVLVSTDKGRCYGGAKLPDLCVLHGVTHILVSGSIHKAKRFEKLRVLLAAWPRIVWVAGQPPGSRFYLRYDGHEKSVVVTARAMASVPRTAHATPTMSFTSKRAARKTATRRPRRDKNAGHPTIDWDKKA